MTHTKLIATGMLLLLTCYKPIKATAFDHSKNIIPAVHYTDTALPYTLYDSVLYSLYLDEEIPVAPVFAINRQMNAFADDYLDLNAQMLGDVKEKNASYFKLIDQVFSRKGLPTELKYLAVVESKMKTKAISRAGAAGAWQLMPATARYLKLKVTKSVDERKHFYKSTEAAGNYLVTLYKMFDDWLLVLAAYNSGPGTVLNAIKKTGTRNFWKLQYSLPRETRDHVKKYISTHIYYEGSGGVTTMTKQERNMYEKRLLDYQQQLEEMQPQHMIETNIVLTMPAILIREHRPNKITPVDTLLTALR